MKKDIGFVIYFPIDLTYIASWKAGDSVTEYLSLAKVWQSYGDAYKEASSASVCENAEWKIVPVTMEADVE